MFEKSWVRILVFGLIAVIALGAVGVVAYRAGYQVGAQSAQAYPMGFGSRFWGSRQGNNPVFPSPFDGDAPRNQPNWQGAPRMFGGRQPSFGGRMPYHMGFSNYNRGWFPFSWFGPGLLLGLILLGGLTFLLIRAYNKPSVVEEKKPSRRKASK